MKSSKFIALFIGFALLFSVAFGINSLAGVSLSKTINEVASPTPTSTVDPDNGRVNIVCIGDSITEGRGSSPSFTSYRYPLFKKLVDANVNFEMVGPKQGNFISNLSFDPYKGKVFSNRHYGTFGIKASQVKEDVYNDLLPIDFNTAIILLGTNDRNTNGTDAEVLASANKLLTIWHP